MSSEYPVTEDRADALLVPIAVSGKTRRDACITLASLALDAADGDEALTRGTLRDALEAIGVIPYVPGKPSKNPSRGQRDKRAE